jgi:hypothetical protein
MLDEIASKYPELLMNSSSRTINTTKKFKVTNLFLQCLTRHFLDLELLNPFYYS